MSMKRIKRKLTQVALHRLTDKQSWVLPMEPVSRRFGLDRGRPIDRYYIERFLAQNGNDIRGRVVEIAEPTYTKWFGGNRVTKSEVLDAAKDAPHATICANLTTGEGLESDAFDCFICTQTISLTPNPTQALQQISRCLKPGGVLLATFPGISQQSQIGKEEFPDYWRFTKLGVHQIIQAAFPASNTDITIEAHGTVQSAAAFLYGLADHEIPFNAFDPHDPEYEVVITARVVCKK